MEQSKLNQSLLNAAKQGNVEDVSRFLDQQADINAKDTVLGKTSLHCAADNGHESIVSCLLSRGASVDDKDDDGQTPLHFAAGKGHESIVSFLLSQGASVNGKDNDGWTSLHFAASEGHESTVSFLLSQGAAVDAKDNFGKTSLHCAAANGHESIVSCLLSRGSSVDDKDDDGQTPLHFAAGKGHVTIVSFLLSQGASVDGKNNDGQTSLHDAAYEGHESTVSCLLSQGAQVDAKDNLGRTSLRFAAQNGHESTVSCLLSHGASVDETYNNGQTSLHDAAHEGHESTVSCLLSQGASVNAKDNLGQTSLHFAARRDNKSIVSCLLSQGAQVDAKDNFGFTPLHFAAINDSKASTIVLLNNGAMNELDSKGRTALDLAEENNAWDVVQLYKKILSSGLPKELLYLSTQDEAMFKSNLRSGFYLSYVGKIMCVGCKAVGKTAITSVLRAKQPSKERTSTEGIDLHIHRAAIDMERGEWVIKPLDIEDVAFRDLLHQPKMAIPIFDILDDDNITDDSIDERYDEADVSYDTTSNQRLKKRPFNVGDVGKDSITPKVNTQQISTLQWMKQWLGLEKANIHTVEELQKEAVRRGKKGLLSNSLAPVNMMDFGRQGVFYSTHQSFLTYRGIYILVINGSKGFDEEMDTESFIPGQHGKPTARRFTFFWVSSIESCSKGGSDEFPKILVVLTHKDKVQKDETDQKANAIFVEIEQMFQGTTASKHLVLEHRIFINAMDPDDPGYRKLKEVLVDLLRNQPSWGEKVPKPWIYLKLMMNRAVEKGFTVMSMETMRSINLENPVRVLTDKELQLFLKMTHLKGEIIYFSLPGLRDNILISPTFLVHALKSLITDKEFCKGYRRNTIESMNKNGLVKIEEILDIWKGEKKFEEYQQYLLSLMEHLDILALPRKYNTSGELIKPDYYYVPSLVKTKYDTSYFEDRFKTRALGLSYKFYSSLLPPSVGYRLIASCIDMFEIKTNNDEVMLFSGVAVVKVTRNLDLAVIMRSDRVDIFLVHSSSRFHIARGSAAGISECLKDILLSIIESYRVMSSEGNTKPGVSFQTEFPCYNISEPCYNMLQTAWTCKHGYKLGSDIMEKWSTNKEKQSCTPDCQGLSETALQEKPSERHLANLALQFSWEEMYNFIITLGLEVKEIEWIQLGREGSVLNVMFLYLRKWRMKTDGSVGDIIKALHESNLDKHRACQMDRNSELSDTVTSSVLERPVTDQVIDAIAREVIDESLLLSVQLDEKASFWIGMKDEKNKTVNINREVLTKWRREHPKKDQMKYLAQALCNVGVNITSLLPEI